MTTESNASTSSKATTPNAKQGIATMFSAVILVLLVAAGAFWWKHVAREREVLQYHAVTVAHRARQVELNFASLVSVVGNLRPRADAIDRVVNAQSARASGAADSRTLAAKRRDEADKQITSAQNAYNALDAVLSKSRERSETTLTKLGQASNKCEEANQSAQRATLSVNDAAKTSHEKATQAAEKTQKADADAQRALSIAQNTQPAAPSPEQPAPAPAEPTAPAVGPTMASPDAASSVTGATNPAGTPAPSSAEPLISSEYRNAAEQALASAREAQQAQQAAAKAEDAFREQLQPAIQALQAATDACKESEGAKQEHDRATQRVQQVASAREAARNQLEVARLAAIASFEERKNLDEALERSSIPDEIAPLLQGVPRSYAANLLSCVKLAKNDLTRCALQQIVETAGLRSSTLQLVACPSYLLDSETESTWLNRDEKSLLFPISKKGNSAGALCAQIPVTALMARSTKRDEGTPGELDDVVLVGPTGKVLDATASPLRLESLPDFDPKNAITSSVRPGVSLGADKYRLFQQPADVRLEIPRHEAACGSSDATKASPPAARADGLLVVGLVREDRLFEQSLGSSPNWYLWTALLAGLAVLALPLAKLWFLGPSARFDRFDSVFLLSSVALATLLAALVCWALSAGAGLSAQRDERLAELGNEYAALVSKRITSAANDLEFLFPETQTLRSRFAAQNISKPDEAATMQAPAALERACADFTFQPMTSTLVKLARGISNNVLGGTSLQLSSPLQTFASETHFTGDPKTWQFCERTNLPISDSQWSQRSQFIFADSLGHQLVKLTGTDHASAPVDVADRVYFQRALRQDARCLGDETCALGVADVVYSSVNGLPTLTVSRPSFSESSPNTPNGVATFAVDLSNENGLLNPVLPVGFQASVVDATGQILLHTDMTGQHGHRLLEEVSNRGELESRMHAREDGLVDLVYQGAPTRAYVRHLANPDWFVILLAPKSFVHTTVAEVVWLALAGSGVYLLVALITVILVMLFRLRRDDQHGGAPRWVILPHASRSERYLRDGLIALTVAVVAVGLATVLPWAPLFLLLGLPLGLLVLALLRLPTAERETVGADDAWAAKKWERHQLSRNYCVWLLGFLSLTVLAPVSILFTAATDYVVEHAARTELIHYADALGDSHCAVGGSDAAIRPECDVFFGLKQVPNPQERPEEPSGNPFLAAAKPEHLPGWWELPAHQRLTRESTSHPAQWSIVDNCWYWPVPCGAALVPPLNSAGLVSLSSATTGLSRSEHAGDSSDGSYLWSRTPGRLTMTVNDGRQRSVLASALPDPLEPAESLWGFALFCFLFLAGCWVAWTSIRRVFFTRLISEVSSYEQLTAERALELCAKENRVLLLGLTEAVRAELRLRTKPLAHLTKHLSDPDLVLLVEDLAMTVESPYSSARLEEALQAGVRIIAMATRPPLDDAPTQERARWATLLEKFTEHRSATRLPQSASKAHLAILWAESTADERRMLAHIAIDGYATPHPESERVLRNLVLRGILCGDSLTIHPDVAEHVRAEVSATDLATWQRESAPSAWDRWKAPLATAAASLVAIISASRPELAFTAATAPAAAVGIPALLRALAALLKTPSA